MGSVKKSSFVITWLFSDGKKAWGGVSDKIFCDETKILSGIWTADHGRDATGDRAEILIVYGFKTILTIYGLYITDITVIWVYINNI